MLFQVYQQLFDSYGPQNWWPAKTPFEMMIGAILTQNTSWTNVEKALAQFEIPFEPQALLKLSNQELIDWIRPSGFFNQKSERLKLLAQWFLQYDGDVTIIQQHPAEDIRKALLSLKGVGPETADSIMLYAFEWPFFVVDAYTRRIFSRLGYPVPKDYEAFRLQIEADLNRPSPSFYNEFHALIVYHAKEHCTKKPKCAFCPLTALCQYPLQIA